MGDPSGSCCSSRGSRGGKVWHATLGLAHTRHSYHFRGMRFLWQSFPILGASTRYCLLGLSNSAPVGSSRHAPLVQPISCATSRHRTWCSLCLCIGSRSGFRGWRHVGSGASMRSNIAVKRDAPPASWLRAPYLQRWGA